MSRVIADRTQETSTTTGTGALDLDGAKTGFQSFVAGVGDGAEVHYVIVAVDSSNEPTGEWEVGLGTVTDATPDTLSRGTVIASSNAGSLVNFSSGTKNVFLAIPSDWYTDRQNVGANLLHVRDEKASGTAAGGASSSTWNVRDLNTVVVNDITGASLASNQVTLPAGTYRIRAESPIFRCEFHQLRLRNVTDTSTALVGMSGYSDSEVETPQVTAVLSGQLTIAAEKTFELQHYTSNARATDGLGTAANTGEGEVYAQVWITRVPID